MKKYVLLFCLCMLSLPCFAKDTASPAVDLQAEPSVFVHFPKGSLKPGKFSLQTVNKKDLVDQFDEIALGIYHVNTMLSYQVILETGRNYPTDDRGMIKIKLPKTFRDKKPAEDGFELFALEYQDNEMETLDEFVLVPSRYNPETGELEATLQRYYFTDQRRKDSVKEAIFIVGTTPGENPPYAEDKEY